MEDDTAGHPVKGCKWTHKTTAKVADVLNNFNIKISANTGARLLKQMGYRLRVNLKNLESGIANPPAPYERDAQFKYIAEMSRNFASQDLPVISVDTKSRELIGQFCQAGKQWSRKPIEVFDHDFPSDAIGVAIPYGIFDPHRNHGFISIGTSFDTPEFAVEAIKQWWVNFGSRFYPGTNRMLILADCGGSNGYRSRLWKFKLQHEICNRFGINVTIAHYPPGTSKWNPIEHRMFSFISKNWAAQPLNNYETALNFIRSTKTTGGLRVCARLNTKQYEKGIKVTDAQMQQLNLQYLEERSSWNYSIVQSEM